ncbi:MAG: ANTAR domain-containing protein [Oscillospiraceae bacterium]|nr:ANTAR domain-containing protein [Oscillospiraceae bacterium]
MIEKKRMYSMLIVSTVANFSNAIIPLLPDGVFNPIDSVHSIGSARKAIDEKKYDIVIINKSNDDFGVRFAIDISVNWNAVVLLIVNNDVYADITNRVTVFGVFTLYRPVSKWTMSTALSWMASARERDRKKEQSEQSAADKLEEIRIINRAKWILIGEMNMTEEQAHRHIEKQAMDMCNSKKEIAESIIKTYT